MSLAASAKLQSRAIVALVVSRMRSRYLGSRAGYVWAIVEPMAWVFVLKLALKHSGADRPPVGDSFEVFFVTGIVIARMWRNIVGSVSQVLVSGRSARLPGLMRLDLCYAAWVLEVVTAGVVLTLCLTVLQVFGFDAVPGDLFHCLVVFFALAVFSLAFALALALLLHVAPGLQHFSNLLLMAMFITSGFAFVVDRMPPATRDIVLWNPLVHFVEWFRMGFFSGYECRSLDLNYVFAMTVIFLALGLAGERAFRRRAGREIEVADETEI